MRCRECNIDLSENYTKCPLCGSDASPDDANLKDIKPAPYPHNAPVKPVAHTEKVKGSFSFEKVKAFFNL